MGAKQTKLEGGECYLPATPPPQLKLMKPLRNYGALLKADEEQQMDPRSPSGNRTPIQVFHTAEQQQKRETVLQVSAVADEPSHPLGLLRKRFLKGFTYSLNDPRSPGVDLNRTPLIFEGEKLNLDDTFADLFVESRAAKEAEKVMPTDVQLHVAEAEIVSAEEMPMDADIAAGEEDEEDVFCGVYSSPNNSSSVFCSLVETDEGESETMPCPALLQQTPPLAAFQPQKPLDPRSPTYGVDRTPIIFSDDEAAEDVLLENILATLSLQLNASNASSDLSFGTPSAEPSLEMARHEERMWGGAANKPLERLRFGAARKPARKRHAHRSRIYEDRENDDAVTAVAASTSSLPMTPPKPPRQQQQLASSSPCKRTPLSCVKNRSHLHLRARNNEALGKLLKARPLSAFDESATKRANQRIMQGAGESPEMLQLS